MCGWNTKSFLIQSEEGWAASCPALRGCHSQGVTREEAVANIHVAICEWIEAENIEADLNPCAPVN